MSFPNEDVVFITKEECIRRIKLSIDRQLDGEIKSIFPINAKIQMSIIANKAVATVEECGMFIIEQDGCLIPISLDKTVIN